uniref:Putative ovule protein n=1 Tax=Solanum chacoense TaxID=4108 RepID=A0A0V0GST3_SOLCH
MIRCSNRLSGKWRLPVRGRWIGSLKSKGTQHQFPYEVVMKILQGKGTTRQVNEGSTDRRHSMF